MGKDVQIEKVVQTAKKENAKIVGLSALMTTTVKNMEKTIKALRENIDGVIVFVGGAVLNEEIALQIGADYYSKDPRQMVKILGQLGL